MSGFGTPPVILADSQPHKSVILHARSQQLLTFTSSFRLSWQLKFSIIWSSALGFFLLLSIPRIIRAVGTGRGMYGFKNWFGIKERHDPSRDYDFIADPGESGKHEGTWAQWTVSRYLDNVAGLLNAFFCLAIPKVGLNLGQGQSHFKRPNSFSSPTEKLNLL